MTATSMLQIAPATTMAPSCSASGTAGGEDEPCPAGDEMKGQTNQPGLLSLAHLLKGPDAAPPEYLTLSLTPAGKYTAGPPGAGEVTVTLKKIRAPPGYLSLSITPSDEEAPRPSEPAASHAKTSSGGSVVANGGSAMSEAALVHAATANNVLLPPKERKLADCVYQETAGTAPDSTSPSLSLAIVIHGDAASRTSTSSARGGDVETRSPAAAMADAPIDAVPLQAVRVRGGASRALRLTSSVAVETIDGGPPEAPAWIRETLRLPVDHPLHFIGAKLVQQSDLGTQQSRFLIPRDHVTKRLRPLLSHEQLVAANMVELKQGQPAQKKKKPTPTPAPQPRVQGEKHGGLVVHVVVNRDGHRMDAELTTWKSSQNSVLKFGKHNPNQRFGTMSGLRVNDEVHIWAFLRWHDLYLVIEAVTQPPQPGQQIAA